MKIYSIVILFTLLCFSIVSCNDDDVSAPQEFVVAFENPSVSLSQTDTEVDIVLVFSRTATEDGSVDVSYALDNTIYGTDFTTLPNGATGTISVPFTIGADGASISFSKLQNALEGTIKTVTFSIAEVNHTAGRSGGTTSTLIDFSEAPALGGVELAEVGGPNQGNQVFIDLSSQTSTVSHREAWDLGFYGGSDYRVILNSSLYMAAGQTTFTDIDAVTSADVASLQPLVAVGTFNPANAAYIDSPDGDLSWTAIAEISATDAENYVYLLNLGAEVGTETPDVGGVNTTGDPRGWKKIRILRSGSDYILQYADLDSDTHQEVIITKDADYNFSYYSIVDTGLASIEPQKDMWDFCFTVFTNIIPGAGSYGYSDFIVSNRQAGVVGYQVSTDDFSYNDFSLSDVDSSLFVEDQRFIGGNWRDVFDRDVHDDRFFVVEDSSGNLYKLKFTKLVNANGERGYPEFEYSLL